jgi:hypothetical protein
VNGHENPSQNEAIGPMQSIEVDSQSPTSKQRGETETFPYRTWYGTSYSSVPKEINRSTLILVLKETRSI